TDRDAGVDWGEARLLDIDEGHPHRRIGGEGSTARATGGPMLQCRPGTFAKSAHLRGDPKNIHETFRRAPAPVPSYSAARRARLTARWWGSLLAQTVFFTCCRRRSTSSAFTRRTRLSLWSSYTSSSPDRTRRCSVALLTPSAAWASAKVRNPAGGV